MTESLAAAEVPVLTGFEPFTAEFRADPYPEYRRIAAMGGPVYWEYYESYIVSSYADARTVLASPHLRLRPPPEVAELLAAIVPEPLLPMQQTILFSDPPDHDRLRSLTRRAFTSAAVQRVVEAARPYAESILERAREEGRIEVVGDFAFPVALRVIGDVLGLPREDLPELRDWGQMMTPAADIPAPPGAPERAVEGFELFRGYFARLAERERGRSGLFHDLVDAWRAGRLSHDELDAMATLLFISGHETLVAFMASAFLTFARRPDALALLRERPELAPNAVDEVLRYESPLQLATAGGGRWTVTDLQIGGRVIPAGQRVLTFIGAAHRDPAVFPDPDRFDITRPGGRNLALGHGLHYCVGAVLAKMEGRMALETLARCPVELGPPPQSPAWLPLFMQRRLAELPLSLHALR